MGVNGLTQFLRPIYVKRRVKDLRNSTFGVDAMAWLYRGFYGQKYANNDINERFLSFYYRMLAQLRKYNIKVSCRAAPLSTVATRRAAAERLPEFGPKIGEICFYKDA